MFKDHASLFLSLSRNRVLQWTYVQMINVSQVKFLGTIIDDKLTCRPHIDYKSKKLSKAIAIKYRIKPYVTQETVCGLYYFLVYPYLTYCIVIWGNTFKTYLKSVISLQRKAVRCLNFRNHNDFSIDAFMLELQLIKLSDLNKYLTSQFMHKLYYGLVPKVFNDHFTCNSSVHEYNTRLREDFHVHKIGNDYGNEHCSTMVVCYGTKSYFWMSIVTVL